MYRPGLRPHATVLAANFAVLAVLTWSTSVGAEEPLVQRYTFVGNADFFATGAAMAADGPDADTTNVDMLVHPAITEITEADLVADATLRKAFLYWGGSIVNDDCNGGTIDDTVSFAPPELAASEVVADVCYCSDAAAQSYDIQVCRADVTDMITKLVGEYAVDGFSALINNGTTNNASFSIVLVYSAPSLPNRSLAIYDGLLTMWNQSNADEIVILDQIEIDTPPAGDLTWYALEGDVGGSGDEAVSVVGKPGNLSTDLFDAINPVDNPMNHTINTTAPPQVDALGVDIDEFDISAALTPGDTSVETTYLGGGDKYWIAYNVVGVNIYAPNFAANSGKTWTLEDDADQSGDPSPGDTIRYTIHLENTGDVAGSVNLEDPMPPQAASLAVVDAGGGVDLSTPDTLIIEGIDLDPDASTEVIFDVVIADDAGGMQMINVAVYDAPPDGGAGPLEAPPVPIAGDGDGDTGDGDGDGDTGDGDGDGDGDTGDGDGDPGDGDPGDGDGDPGESGDESGSDGSGGDTSGGGTGFTGNADDLRDGDGCNCATGSRSPAPLGALILLALVQLRRRPD